MLYLWLSEMTKVRIRFQNYLFKADKRISITWDITEYLLLHFWLLEITQGRIKFWNCLLQVDKRMKHSQNLYGGYNLENTFVE